MENTLENKAKFFAQYWGQKVWTFEWDLGHKSIENEITNIKYYLTREDLITNYLELTPLSQISDEDALWLAKEVFINDYFKSQSEDVLIKKIRTQGFNKEKSKRVDYLRSKGYALPYMGLSVEKQVEYGWIKLKINN